MTREPFERWGWGSVRVMIIGCDVFEASRRMFRTVGSLVMAAGLLVGGCIDRSPVQCEEDSNCDGAAGGLCVTATTGNHWCAYPDTACSDGYRYSNDDVGDGLGDSCIDGFTLTIVLGGSGSGAVTSPLASCTDHECTQSFPSGAQIHLTASATQGNFLGWSSDCTGPDDCIVTMDRDRKVGALFGLRGQGLWVQHLGSVTNEAGVKIAVDSKGDVVVIGAFSGAISPTPTITLNTIGMTDIFIEKLDGTTGDVVWARSFGSTGNELPSDVAIDAADNIYVTGDFANTIDFGDGPTTVVGNNPTDRDAFVLKLTPDGQLGWSRKFGSAFPDGGAAIAVRGNALGVLGHYNDQITIGSNTLPVIGQEDIFVASMTLDGDVNWAKGLGGTKIDEPRALAIDSQGNFVIVGDFEIAASFGGAQITAVGQQDVFLAKLAGADGAHLFSKGFGSAATDIPYAVGVASDDGITMAGTFRASVDFGGPTPLSSGVGDMFGGAIFLANYTSAGAFMWAEAFVGTAEEAPEAMAIDAADEIALSGTFCGTISFGGANLTSADDHCSIGQTIDHDIFVARFKASDGSHLGSIRAGGTADEGANGVAQTSDGRCYVTGGFDGFSEFAGQAFNSLGGSDAYVLGLAPL